MPDRTIDPAVHGQLHREDHDRLIRIEDRQEVLIGRMNNHETVHVMHVQETERRSEVERDRHLRVGLAVAGPIIGAVLGAVVAVVVGTS